MIKINNFAHMKKIKTFVILFALFFVACETEFEVSADWKEVTVVYGLLDQSNDQQYIKINKAYLGIGDALQMASVADSINYNPADLEVKIIKVKDGAFGSIDLLDSIYLDTTLIAKDDGLFATNENIIYTTSISDKSFFRANDADEKDYILSILNKKSGKKVWAKTNLIHQLNLDIPSAKPMGFYTAVPDPVVFPLEKALTTVNWFHSTNGKIYEIIARIYYTNFYDDNVDGIWDRDSLTYLDWLHPQIIYDGRNEMNYTFDGHDFVNTLARKLSNEQNLLARRLSHVELLFSVGSEDLQTYMDLNEPFEGLVQERPVFTNINNGIGFFSCRYNKSHTMLFPTATREGLSHDLDSLHFVYP